MIDTDYYCLKCDSKLEYFSRGDYLCPNCGASFHEEELNNPHIIKDPIYFEEF